MSFTNQLKWEEEQARLDEGIAAVMDRTNRLADPEGSVFSANTDWTSNTFTTYTSSTTAAASEMEEERQFGSEEDAQSQWRTALCWLGAKANSVFLADCILLVSLIGISIGFGLGNIFRQLTDFIGQDVTQVVADAWGFLAQRVFCVPDVVLFGKLPHLGLVKTDYLERNVESVRRSLSRQKVLVWVALVGLIHVNDVEWDRQAFLTEVSALLHELFGSPMTQREMDQVVLWIGDMRNQLNIQRVDATTSSHESSDDLFKFGNASTEVKKGVSSEMRDKIAALDMDLDD